MAAVLAAAGLCPAAAGAGGQWTGGVLSRQLPAGHDHVFRWNGSRWVERAREPLGSLRLATPAATGIHASGASLRKTVCLRLVDDAVQGRRCWQEFAVEGEEDPSRNYRVWWVTGSSRGLDRSRLTAARDGIRAAGRRAEVVDWHPGSTMFPRRCRRIEDSTQPEPVVGSSYRICRGTAGLIGLGAKAVRFGWTGVRRPGAWVGSGGGAIVSFPPGAPPDVSLRFRQRSYPVDGSCEKDPGNTRARGA